METEVEHDADCWCQLWGLWSACAHGRAFILIGSRHTRAGTVESAYGWHPWVPFLQLPSCTGFETILFGLVTFFVQLRFYKCTELAKKVCPRLLDSDVTLFFLSFVRLSIPVMCFSNALRPQSRPWPLTFTKFSTSGWLRKNFSTSGNERINFAGGCISSPDKCLSF